MVENEKESGILQENDRSALLIKKFITEKEAAAIFSYSTSWFQKQRQAKQPPPYIKVKGKILYDRDELEKWFRGGEVR